MHLPALHVYPPGSVDCGQRLPTPSPTPLHRFGGVHCIAALPGISRPLPVRIVWSGISARRFVVFGLADRHPQWPLNVRRLLHYAGALCPEYSRLAYSEKGAGRRLGRRFLSVSLFFLFFFLSYLRRL